jgi:hypothetical protein
MTRQLRLTLATTNVLDHSDVWHAKNEKMGTTIDQTSRKPV